MVIALKFKDYLGYFLIVIISLEKLLNYARDLEETFETTQSSLAQFNILSLSDKEKKERTVFGLALLISAKN